MITEIRLKKGSGVPSSLKYAEPAVDMLNRILYIGASNEADGGSDFIKILDEQAVMDKIAETIEIEDLIFSGEGENSVIVNTRDNESKGHNSIATGYKTIAGMLGYYYSAIEFGEEIFNTEGNSTGTYGPCKITLSKEQGILPDESFTIGYAVGDVISMVHDEKHHNFATITAIENNIITVNALPFNTFELDTNFSNFSMDDYELWVAQKPTSGEVSLGWYAHSEGEGSVAIERATHAEGRDTRAEGQYSHTEGRRTLAYYASHAEGLDSKATGRVSHAEGNGTVASGGNSHSEGNKTIARGYTSHAEGNSTIASADGAHSEGQGSIASGLMSHAEGLETTASGQMSHSEGIRTTASGYTSHSEGVGVTASGYASHAEGSSTVAACDYSHAEGYGTDAIGPYTHAEGRSSIASGNCSHAEGRECRSEGEYSHAEGQNTFALNSASHSEGAFTVASGVASHAEGERTISRGAHQHVQGKWNIEDTAQRYAHIVGDGTGENYRSNLHTVDWSGHSWYKGNVYVGGNSQDNAKKLSTEEYVNNVVNIEKNNILEMINNLHYYCNKDIVINEDLFVVDDFILNIDCSVIADGKLVIPYNIGEHRTISVANPENINKIVIPRGFKLINNTEMTDEDLISIFENLHTIVRIHEDGAVLSYNIAEESMN